MLALMEKLAFITTNIHKVAETAAILKEYNIDVEQIAYNYPEDKEASVKEVAKKAAKEMTEKFQRPVLVDDSGIYFRAYKNFPGALSKFVIKSIAYDGIFRLLQGKDREATFFTVLGYCEPIKEPQLFVGKSKGTILEKYREGIREAMPFEYIFVPEGETKTFAEMTIEEKGKFS